jgi:hypothetical protein
LRPDDVVESDASTTADAFEAFPWTNFHAFSPVTGSHKWRTLLRQIQHFAINTDAGGRATTIVTVLVSAQQAKRHCKPVTIQSGAAFAGQPLD